MANLTAGNPLYGYEAGVLTTKQVKIKAIEWVSDQTATADIAAADDVLLSDANGQRVWGKRAVWDGDGDYVPFPDGLVANGLTVTTIDGGYLYVYIY
uniref:Uncharacterized protein n=1 Tax=viral metagenome TaxID=1070528 RepID=A0A6H1ZTH6_9ZZZZ